MRTSEKAVEQQQQPHLSIEVDWVLGSEERAAHEDEHKNHRLKPPVKRNVVAELAKGIAGPETEERLVVGDGAREIFPQRPPVNVTCTVGSTTQSAAEVVVVVVVVVVWVSAAITVVRSCSLKHKQTCMQASKRAILRTYTRRCARVSPPLRAAAVRQRADWRNCGCAAGPHGRLRSRAGLQTLLPTALCAAPVAFEKGCECLCLCL